MYKKVHFVIWDYKFIIEFLINLNSLLKSVKFSREIKKILNEKA